MRSGPTVILDGAHNPAKISTLVANVKKEKYRKVYIVFGAGFRKDIKSVLKLLAEVSDHFILTRYSMSQIKGASPTEMHKALKSLGKKIKMEVHLDSNEALDRALKLAGKNDLILVTGSFFLTSELRKRWYSEESVLKKRKAF